MSELYGDHEYHHDGKKNEDNKFVNDYFDRKGDHKQDDEKPHEDHCPHSCYCHGDRESDHKPKNS